MATRWNPCSYLPRRLQIVVSLTVFVLACILFLGTSSSDHTVDPYLDRVPYGPRLQAGEEEEEKFDAMGNKIESTKKKVKLSSAELRKKKKDRMARRKRGEEVFSDEED